MSTLKVKFLTVAKHPFNNGLVFRSFAPEVLSGFTCSYALPAITWSGRLARLGATRSGSHNLLKQCDRLLQTKLDAESYWDSESHDVQVTLKLDSSCLVFAIDEVFHVSLVDFEHWQDRGQGMFYSHTEYSFDDFASVQSEKYAWFDMVEHVDNHGGPNLQKALNAVTTLLSRRERM